MKKIFSSLALLFVLTFALWRVSKLRSFQFFGQIHHRVQTTEKVVALTYDDGPGQNTGAILEILEREAVPATFFMIGKNIEDNPQMAKKVLSLGHQIGNHSYSHQRATLSGPAFWQEEVEKTDQLIRTIGFNEEIMFRPPFGKKLFTLPWVLHKMNKLSITWDAESRDTETQDEGKLEKNVLSHVRPGSIILFHDGGGAKPGTIGMTAAVIKELKNQGYRFLTVAQLLKLQEK